MLTVVVYGIMFIVTALASSKFNTYNRKLKVAFPCFNLFLAIFTTVIVLTLSDFEVNNLYIIYFMVLPTTLMLFIVYINEVIKDAVLMRSKLIKMEKWRLLANSLQVYRTK